MIGFLGSAAFVYSLLMDICAINTVNFLAHARTMMESYRKHNPDGRMFLLLLDDPECKADTKNDPFIIVRPEDLGVPRLGGLNMLYNAYEFSMSLRPHFLRYLQEKHGSEKLAFLDSDLYITGSLKAAEKLLDTHSIVLTPSFLEPIPEDGYFPSDRDFLTAGIFNGGFFACRTCDETSDILSWMAERLEKYSFVRPEECMFGDQAWLDMIPAIAPTMAVLRDSGYNVSHWNLHERMITENNGIRMAGNDPLVFYHFSGFDPEASGIISRHQNRFTLKDHPALEKLFEEYREKLLAHKYADIRPLPYGFGHFKNGVVISPAIRRIFESVGGIARYENPFEVGPGTFFEWLTTPITHLGKKLALWNVHIELWKLSMEAQAKFAKPATADIGAFCHWICRERAKELDLDPFFTASLLPHVTVVGPARISRWKLMLRRRHSFQPYQTLCNVVRKMIGRNLYNRLKPRRDPMYALKLRVSFRPGGGGVSSGLNVVSSATARTGIAEGMRGLIAALEKTSVPLTHIDSLATPGRQQQEHSRVLDFPYDTTIVGGGLREIEQSLFSMNIPISARKQLIGYVPWELPHLPEAEAQFLENTFNEIWAPSSFTTEAIGRSVKIPVVTMPLPVDISSVSEKSRSDFGLPEHTFIFLFAFDMHSRIERKNPEGLITSFIQTFGSQKDVMLVLSIKNSADFPREYKALSLMTKSHQNIRLHTDYLPRPDMLALLRCANCFVSLHRSEGFGLLIAESMALGVPVIATDYGGSTDFVNTSTGFPVSYELVTLKKDAGPYTAGEMWAEPDTMTAAALMKHVVCDPADVSEKAARASELMKTAYSKESIGARMKERLITMNDTN